MGVQHGFLQTNRADAEGVTHHDNGKLGQHDEETTPCRRAADGRGGAIDTGRNTLDRVFHGFPSVLYCCPRISGTPLMAHDHDHDDPHGSELSEMQLRVRALETVLAEK